MVNISYSLMTAKIFVIFFKCTILYFQSQILDFFSLLLCLVSFPIQISDSHVNVPMVCALGLFRQFSGFQPSFLGPGSSFPNSCILLQPKNEYFSHPVLCHLLFSLRYVPIALLPTPGNSNIPLNSILLLQMFPKSRPPCPPDTSPGT